MEKYHEFSVDSPSWGRDVGLGSQVLSAAFGAFRHINWALRIDVQRDYLFFLFQVCKSGTRALILSFFFLADSLFTAFAHRKVWFVDWLFCVVFFSSRTHIAWLLTFEGLAVGLLLRWIHCKCILALPFLFLHLIIKVLELRNGFSFCCDVARVLPFYFLPFLCLLFDDWTPCSGPCAMCLFLDVDWFSSSFWFFENDRLKDIFQLMDVFFIQRLFIQVL